LRGFSPSGGEESALKRETGKVIMQHIFSEGWPPKLTYVFAGGKFSVYYEIAETRIQSKKFSLVAE